MNYFNTFRKILNCISLLSWTGTGLAQQATQLELKATNKSYKIQRNQIKLEWNVKVNQQQVEIWRSYRQLSDSSKPLNLNNLQFILLPPINNKNDSIDSYIDRRNIESGHYYYKLRIGKLVSEIAKGEASFDAAAPKDSTKQLCEVQLSLLSVIRTAPSPSEYELSYEYAHTCAKSHEIRVFLSDDKVLDAQDISLQIVRQSPDKVVVLLPKVKNSPQFFILKMDNQIDIQPIKY